SAAIRRARRGDGIFAIVAGVLLGQAALAIAELAPVLAVGERAAGLEQGERGVDRLALLRRKLGQLRRGRLRLPAWREDLCRQPALADSQGDQDRKNPAEGSAPVHVCAG